MAMTFQIFVMLAAIFLYIVIGAKSYCFLCKLIRVKIDDVGEPPNYIYFVFGLLLHLFFILLLKCCQLPWWLAFFLPLVLPCLWIRDFHFKRPKFSLNFVLWFFTILSIGISIFHFINNQIETPWANNYGDLTFHFGMIASFVKGNLFPPVFHLYAGESLSYPFMINLWSAAYWWMNQSFDSLHLIFIFQWTVLWSIVFFALNGNKYRILPWTILLGGGTYDVLNSFSWKLITESKPWSVFLSTVWITQRAALFGVVIMLVVLCLIYDALGCLKEEKKNKILSFSLFAGCVVGLSPLTHVHICLVVGIFCASIFFAQVITPALKEFFKNYFQYLKKSNVSTWHIPICLAFWVVPIFSLLIIQHVGGETPNLGEIFKLTRDTSVLPDSQGAILSSLKIMVTFFSLALLLINIFVFVNEGKGWFKCLFGLVSISVKSDLLLNLKCKGFILFCGGSLLGLLFTPWILGKSSIIKFIYGWPPLEGVDVGLWQGVSHSLSIWFTGAFSLFIMFFIFVLVSRKSWESFIIAVLFALANFVLLAYWDWDQIKVFIAIYVIFIFLWSRSDVKAVYRLHYLLIILCIPALIECWRIWSLESMTTPFSKDIILEAKAIEKNTPQDAIIASAPDHNTPVLLSGRRMFFGYPGTLWSHGIKYKDREWMFKNMSLLCNCEKNTSSKGQKDCPDYILWNDSSRRYWVNQTLCQNSRHVVGNLYKLK